MEKKRTRAARHTACGRCKKAHRVCDGNRPCKRCFLRGKSSLCQTPPKQQSRRRPRKQKIGFLVDTDIKPPQGCLSVFDQFESVSATGCSHNHGILPESAMQQPVLLALLEQIRDLNDTTSALLITHHTMSVEVTDLKHKITDGYCQQFPKQLTPVASLPESCATNEEIQTLARIDHPTEDILLSASVVASTKDTNRFLPFAIDDATTVRYSQIILESYSSLSLLNAAVLHFRHGSPGLGTIQMFEAAWTRTQRSLPGSQMSNWECIVLLPNSIHRGT